MSSRIRHADFKNTLVGGLKDIRDSGVWREVPPVQKPGGPCCCTSIDVFRSDARKLPLHETPPLRAAPAGILCRTRLSHPDLQERISSTGKGRESNTIKHCTAGAKDSSRRYGCGSVCPEHWNCTKRQIEERYARPDAPLNPNLVRCTGSSCRIH